MGKNVICVLMTALIFSGILNMAFMMKLSFANKNEGEFLGSNFSQMAEGPALYDVDASCRSKNIDVALERIFERKQDGAQQDGTFEDCTRNSRDMRVNWNFNDSEWSKFAYVNDDKTRLIVGVKDGGYTSVLQLEGIVAKHQAEIVNEILIEGQVEAFVVELPLIVATRFIEETRNTGLASYIEPNMKVQAQLIPNDPYWSMQWGPQKIGVDWAWNTTVGSSDILVAVIDTGIYYYHEDLAPNYVALGYDWVNMDADPLDDNGHGTHCAGIIAAVLNNGIGIAGLSQVRIMAEKVLDSWGYGYADWVASGIIHAADSGARIISMSLGGYGYSELLHEAVKYAYEKGVLLIAAAGNDDTNIKAYPAGYEEVIAVAATDQNDYKAWFSNWGDWIELAAPGVDIYSTVPWGYESSSGTSMACPHVSGVAALVWSLYPNKTRDWIRIWLRYNADDLGDIGFDVYFGYGRINAKKAVEVVPPEHELIAYEWTTPPYVEPGAAGIVKVNILNFGENDETCIKAQLIANGTIVDSESIDFLAAGNSLTISLSWNPILEGLYNITFYAQPVPGEKNFENNMLWKYIYVGSPVKAVVLHSAGNIYSDIITNWQVLNNEWQLFGDTMVYIDYITLNKENITYEDIAATKADVLIISCAYDPYEGWDFTDSEIEAITRYVYEGHGLIATAGTFYYYVPNNNKLAPLFGLKELITWYATRTDLLHLINPLHPLFTNVPNPLVFPVVGTAVPSDGRWDSNELLDGEYLALGHLSESAIVVRKGIVYISPWLEVIPPYYHHHLQLLYNTITWSRYQRPQHELVVSLKAPKGIKIGESALLSATVSNFGLNNETNVELCLLIDGEVAYNEKVPILDTGKSYTIDYLWIPKSVKTYNITAYAPPLPEEEYELNNIVTKKVRVIFPVTVAVIGDYSLQLTNLLRENGITAYEREWDIISEISEYDVVIVNRPYDPGFSTFLALINAADTHCVGLIFTSSWPGSSAPYGISLLQWYLQDPRIQDCAYGLGSVYYKVAEEHPILEGWKTGDTIYIITLGDGDHAWFLEYSGTIIAKIGNDRYGIMGGGIAYKIRENGNRHVLLAGLAPQFYANLIHWTEDAKSIFIQSVVWAATKPEHDITARLDVSEFIAPGDTAMIKATAINRGLNNETDVELFLLIEGVTINSTLISDLPVGASHMISYNWTPMKIGIYNVTAYVAPVLNETLTVNNKATIFVKVTYPLIRPVEGQYAAYNYTLTEGDISAVLNLTYLHYISPSQINVTLEFIGPRIYQFGWMIVNIFTRMVEKDSGIGWAGMWYPGWIETNVTIGSEINLLWGTGTVDGSDILMICGTLVECWRIGIAEHGYGYLNVLWYDKASGLWLGMKVKVPEAVLHLTLIDTNVPLGFMYEHDLAVLLDAPTKLAPRTNTILKATVFNLGSSNETNVMLQLLINGEVVALKEISVLARGEFQNLSYLWAPSFDGVYNVTAYAVPLVNEEYTENNVETRIVTVKLISIALISDFNELEYLTNMLNAMGLDYDIYNNNVIGLYTADLNLLLCYKIVIFNNFQRPITVSEQHVLNTYLSLGGNLIVTGYNSLGNPDDPLLADVVRSAAYGDNPYRYDLYVYEKSHPIMNGPYGSFPQGYYITGLYGDCDRVKADFSRGALAVAGLGDGFDKILATEALPGKVVYWNGRGEYDWTLNTDCEIMFKNMIHWMLYAVYEHDLSVELLVPSLVQVNQPTMVCGTVFNIGLVDETNVELQLWINGVKVEYTTIPMLPKWSSFKLPYYWVPVSEGVYNITVYALPVVNENNIANNLATKLVQVIQVTGTRVLVNPQLTVVAIEQNFIVKIEVAEVENMVMWQVCLRFDPKILECLNVSIPEDNIFAGKTVIAPDPVIDNSAGHVFYGAAVFPLVGVSGSGVLCEIQFKGKTEGVSPLEFVLTWPYQTKLEDPEGNEIQFTPLSGFVNVKGELVPQNDIAITFAETSSTAVYPGRMVNITVVAKNLGEAYATFNVSVYRNTTLIETIPVFNLPPHENMTLTFSWNTSGLAPGQKFIIRAEATPLPGETNLGNNIFIDGIVKIKFLGDVNNDDVVDMKDIADLIRTFGTKPGYQRWNHEGDLNNDGVIDLKDIKLALHNYGKRANIK